MRRIRAGALRTPVALGRPVIVKDAAGGEAITWQEFDTMAAIEPLSGREWASATIVKDAVDCKITIRLAPGWIPAARWRVRDRSNGPTHGQLYNLVTAMLIPEQGAAECLAKTAIGATDGR